MEFVAVVMAELDNDHITIKSEELEHFLIDGKVFEAVDWDAELPDGIYMVRVTYSMTAQGNMMYRLDSEPVPMFEGSDG